MPRETSTPIKSFDEIDQEPVSYEDPYIDILVRKAIRDAFNNFAKQNKNQQDCPAVDIMPEVNFIQRENHPFFKIPSRAASADFPDFHENIRRESRIDDFDLITMENSLRRILGRQRHIKEKDLRAAKNDHDAIFSIQPDILDTSILIQRVELLPDEKKDREETIEMMKKLDDIRIFTDPVPQPTAIYWNLLNGSCGPMLSPHLDTTHNFGKNFYIKDTLSARELSLAEIIHAMRKKIQQLERQGRAA